MDEKQQKRISDFFETLDSSVVSTKQFASVIKIILEMLRGIKQQLNIEIASSKTESGISLLSVSKTVKTIEANLQKIMKDDKADNAKKIGDMFASFRSEIKRIETKIPDSSNFSALEAKIKESAREIERMIPSLPEEMKAEKIRDKLESLKNNDRLDKSAIKGIEDIEKDVEEIFDEIKKLKRTKGSYLSGGGGSAVGGKIVKAYDLSASLNGVTKIFSLPAFWRIVSVHASSSPTILRPTTDYTIDGSNFKITFTSEINADTSLASGQSLIIIYAE